jgi:adenine-specific DNA-methyltransferase
MSTASGVKTSHREKTIIKEKEFLLCYAKNSSLVRFNPQYIPKLDWDDEFQYYLDKKNSNFIEDWSVLRLKDVLASNKIPFEPENKKFQDFITQNASRIWRRAFIRNDYKELSQKNPDKIFVDPKGLNYYYRGRQMYFFSDRIHNCFTEDGYKELPSFLLGDFWSDINTGKLFSEGGVDFRNGKKPEFLIARIFELSSSLGDLVFDSFLGSGTTAAVAHKMRRRWIGVELGDHAITHCFPRLKQVVDGEQGGISKAVDWKGGSGFKFYTLAPSLLNQDKFGNWVINKEYNPDMLAAAMAKQEGFRFQPDPHIYWKQGISTEKDFIFTTTQFITVEMLDRIHDEMHPDENLLICCKIYSPECEGRHPNISIKKIPSVLMGKCEFGKEDYSFNIINLPIDREEMELQEEELNLKEVNSKSSSKKKDDNQASLFD